MLLERNAFDSIAFFPHCRVDSKSKFALNINGPRIDSDSFKIIPIGSERDSGSVSE